MQRPIEWLLYRYEDKRVIKIIYREHYRLFINRAEWNYWKCFLKNLGRSIDEKLAEKNDVTCSTNRNEGLRAKVPFHLQTSDRTCRKAVNLKNVYTFVPNFKFYQSVTIVFELEWF